MSINWRIHHLKKVSSTMDMARDLLTDYPNDHYVVIAEQQERGRGRQQRSWFSPVGNLYATLVLPIHNIATAPLFSYVTALAGHSALTHFLKKTSTVSLKWPNDLLIESKKVGGILLEVEETLKSTRLLIGIGINILAHPDDTPYPATHLHHYNCEVHPDALLSKFLESFNDWAFLLDEKGFEPIRQEWLRKRDTAHSNLILKRSRNNSNENIKGSFYDLDKSGSLVLKCKENGVETLRKFNVGDVFFS